MKKELLNGLTEEQIAKVKACKNQEELLKLAKEEGVELNNEQLEAVNGGFCDSSDLKAHCPNCGSSDNELKDILNKGRETEMHVFHCNKCGLNFVVTS